MAIETFAHLRKNGGYLEKCSYLHWDSSNIISKHILQESAKDKQMKTYEGRAIDE